MGSSKKMQTTLYMMAFFCITIIILFSIHSFTGGEVETLKWAVGSLFTAFSVFGISYNAAQSFSERSPNYIPSEPDRQQVYVEVNKEPPALVTTTVKPFPRLTDGVSKDVVIEGDSTSGFMYIDDEVIDVGNNQTTTEQSKYM